MKTKNIMDTIFKNSLIIPNILLENYIKLNMDEKELIFISYLMSYDKDIAFDINCFSNALKYDAPTLMNIIGSLTDKSLIEVITKNENNKLKEYIDISLLKNKLISLILLEEEPNNDNSKIYKKIETEFGRMLSPIECETIKYWLDSKINEELIEEALKEAVLNGVNNLKYIDKILVEWNKKGYKNRLDIKRKKDNNDNVDLFEYDWLDIDE